jgi:(p)ppGpp synthase/HD superfamily hydrolase
MMRQYELVERVKAYNPKADEGLLNRAYVYAMKAHGTQKRASGVPFISHPLEVAAILTELRLDDSTIAAALLHDTIEDTSATRAEIDTIFGPDIGHLVEGLTKILKLDLVSKKAAQAENLRKLLLAIADDVRVLLIKLADRLHNMRTLDFVPEAKRARIAEETLDIYAPLAGRMGMQDLREELEDLAFRHFMPDAFAAVSKRLEELKLNSGPVIGVIESELTQKIEAAGLKAEVSGRLKKPYSVCKKMERKSVSFEQLSDILGFRVLVDKVSDCYAVLGLIHTTWSTVPGRFKDYISTPKQNDYRSIHTTVIGPRRQRVELQIRTFSMNDIADMAGITKPVVYQHFESKRALFLALIEDAGTQMINEITKATVQATGGRLQAEQGTIAFFRWAAADQNRFKFLFDSGTRNDAEFASAVRRVVDNSANAIAPLIAVDLDAAHLRTLAHGVIGATEGVVRHLLDNNIAFNPDVIGKQVADLVWAGLRGVGRETLGD